MDSIIKQSILEKLYDTEETHQAKTKKYFYILRPIANLNFIWEYGKMPYMEYNRTLAKIPMKPEIMAAIQEITAQKMASKEHDLIPKFEPLINYFRSEILRFEHCLTEMKVDKKRNYDSVDGIFRSIIEEAWK